MRSAAGGPCFRMSFLDNLIAQLPFGNKSASPEYFFALNIGLSEVTAIVWSLSGNQLDILGQKTHAYKGTEDLMEKAYKVLDDSLGALEIEPQKILFGVPDAWNSDDNLKEPYLQLLRKILKECDLSPMAFVTTTNAISHLLQKKEGSPQTTVLLGIGDFIEATLVRGGKLMESRSIERSDHLFGDIEKILSQFTEVEVLPSKILLYSTKIGEDMTKLKDNLMSYPWMSKLSFLHFPKIEILDNNTASESIVFAGAAEINPNVALKHSFATIAKTTSNHLLLEEEHRVSRKEKEGLSEKAENFGFVQGDVQEDLKDEKNTEISEDQENHLKDASSKEEEALEDDVLVSPDKELDDRHNNLVGHPSSSPFGGKTRIIKTSGSRHEYNQDEEELGFERSLTSAVSAPAFFGKLVKSPFLSNLKKIIKLPKIAFGKILILPAVLAMVVAAYIFFVKAEVTIFVEPKILEKDAEVIADPEVKDVDGDKKIIPGSFVETTVDGTGKIAATGSKQIGDPAKGKVIIYNKGNSKITFSQGTIFTSNGLKFTLDTSVQVASQSSSLTPEGEVIKWGKSESVGVTASDIGPEGNMPAATELAITGYSQSQVWAKVDEALSGGTSKNVTVVSSDDQKKLQAQVLDELRQKAEKALQEKLTDNKKIITEALTVVDSKNSFNKKVNDQASELSLSSTVRFKGTAYSEIDLRTIVSKLVETNIPEGFQMNLQDTETQADVFKVEKDGKLIFKAKFRAKLMPKLNTDDLKKQMRGKSIEDVVNNLKNIENVVGSEIKFSPSLPNQLTRLPLFDRNITVIISPK